MPWDPEETIALLARGRVRPGTRASEGAHIASKLDEE